MNIWNIWYKKILYLRVFNGSYICLAFKNDLLKKLMDLSLCCSLSSFIHTMRTIIFNAQGCFEVYRGLHVRKFFVNRPRNRVSEEHELCCLWLSFTVAIYCCVSLEKLLNLSMPCFLIHNMRVIIKVTNKIFMRRKKENAYVVLSA